MFWSWFRKTPSARPATRPRLEFLEDRCVPATFTVNWGGDTHDLVPGDGVAADMFGLTSFRAAVEEAEANVNADTIDFAPNVRGTINLYEVLPNITRTLTIDGPGSNNLTIQRNSTAGQFRIFTFVAREGENPGPWVIEDITIWNGNVQGAGGAIAVSGMGRTLNVFGSSFGYNEATQTGGAIDSSQATVNIHYSHFYLNKSTGAGGGAIFTHSGTTNIANSEIYANTAVFGGGVGHLGSGKTNITANSQIFSNTATTGDGGGIWASNALVDMTGGILNGNEAVMGKGGGFYSDATGSDFSGVTVNGNKADKGGGMYLDTTAIMSLTNVTLQNNLAITLGPGIAKKMTATVLIVGGMVQPVVND